MSFLTALFINGVLTGFSYSLGALGLSISFGVMRFVNFAHGEFLTLSAFIAAFLLLYFPFSIVVFLMMVFFSLGGYYFYLLFVRHLLDYSNDHQFIVMASVGAILLGAQHIIFGCDVKNIAVSWAYDALVFESNTIDYSKLISGGVGLSLIIFTHFLFNYTLFGKALLATAQNFEGAELIGLNSKRLQAFIFSFSALCTAIAGIFLATFMSFTPYTASFLTLLSFMIVQLSGFGNILGVLIGGLLVGVGESFASLYVEGSLKYLIVFFLFSFVLFLRFCFMRK